MDESRIVGLITGTHAYPEADLSLDSKANIILHALDIVRRNIEHLVTRGFQPFHEFALQRGDLSVCYTSCVFPHAVAGARVCPMFTTEYPVLASEHSGNAPAGHFIRASALLTSKGELFWLAEKCRVHDWESSRLLIVSDVDLVPLDCQNLRHYLELHPELLRRLLVSFGAVAAHAIKTREERLRRSREVFEQIDRMNKSITIL